MKKLLIELGEKDARAAYFIALDHVSIGDKTILFADPIIAMFLSVTMFTLAKTKN